MINIHHHITFSSSDGRRLKMSVIMYLYTIIRVQSRNFSTRNPTPAAVPMLPNIPKYRNRFRWRCSKNTDRFSGGSCRNHFLVDLDKREKDILKRQNGCSPSPASDPSNTFQCWFKKDPNQWMNMSR